MDGTNSQLSSIEAAEAWKEVVTQFRSLCFMRRQGKAADSNPIIQEQLPRQIAAWSRSNAEDVEAKRSQLEQMFRDEQRRVEDVYAFHELTAAQWQEKILPSLTSKISQEVKAALDEQVAAQVQAQNQFGEQIKQAVSEQLATQAQSQNLLGEEIKQAISQEFVAQALAQTQFAEQIKEAVGEQLAAQAQTQNQLGQEIKQAISQEFAAQALAQTTFGEQIKEAVGEQLAAQAQMHNQLGEEIKQALAEQLALQSARQAAQQALLDSLQKAVLEMTEKANALSNLPALDANIKQAVGEQFAVQAQSQNQLGDELKQAVSEQLAAQAQMQNQLGEQIRQALAEQFQSARQATNEALLDSVQKTMHEVTRKAHARPPQTTLPLGLTESAEAAQLEAATEEVPSGVSTGSDSPTAPQPRIPFDDIPAIIDQLVAEERRERKPFIPRAASHRQTTNQPYIAAGGVRTRPPAST